MPRPGRPRPLPPARRKRFGLPRLLGHAAVLSCLALLALVIDAARLAHGVARPARASAVTLLDRTGTPITTLGDGWSTPLQLQDVAPVMAQAVIAIEDRRFFHHVGVDLIGLGRALVRNLTAGRIAEGGSTITQQLAKLAFLSPERSFLRKAREAALAVWLEATLSKQDILAAYLDRIYLGGGVSGVRAAARRHFGVEAGSLDLAQSALLAGMIRAPSRLDPGRNLEAARARASVVLDAMVQAGAIDRAEADGARTKPARVLPARVNEPLLRTLAQRARRLWPDEALLVRTTLDVERSRKARALLAATLAGQPPRAGAGALLAMSGNGEILAGASVPGDLGGLDRTTEVRRQPGSAFKPVVFAAAIEDGHQPDEKIATGTLVIDGWQPRNLVPPPADEITLAQALSLSTNTAAVRLAMQVGLDRVVQVARRLGISSDLPAVPSLVLGSTEVTMPELATAYAALTSDGVVREPVWWTSATGEDGRRLEIVRTPGVRALSAGTARVMRGMLTDAMQYGTGTAAKVPGGFGKTGTSSGFRDAWFVGGNAKGMIVAVWIGNDDHKPMKGETGGGLPARIFRNFLMDPG
ncbi:MAG TPA: transglycosylase domain-containing protein [Geminicoccus sp.]|uniref:transglycosylase domain-containing protein n=1 Tax=Geminicoccus sp. TaxID=2024832 RepID=UPI002E36B931|nr:transglycosylase domain-containing protein [Geminicoccus sp.]HEX2529796.1 transglycosylase domain-containing protein [Geminicoccus sp.]